VNNRKQVRWLASPNRKKLRWLATTEATTTSTCATNTGKPDNPQHAGSAITSPAVELGAVEDDPALYSLTEAGDIQPRSRRIFGHIDSAKGTRTEPSMVGRAPERRRLADAIDRVAAGSGAAVMISGETGIGKTRVAREAILAADERGFLVLEGRSNPLNKGLSCGPIVEALARCLDRYDHPTRARLVDGLPALGELIEGLGLPSPEHLDDPVLGKTRLFEA
jgi:hypothetical protein